jgi:hypothetical protein
MLKRWLVLLLFLTGAMLGVWLTAPDVSSPQLWAAPLGPNTGDGDVGLAQRLAPAINLLLELPAPGPATPIADQAYLPIVDQ